MRKHEIWNIYKKLNPKNKINYRHATIKDIKKEINLLIKKDIKKVFIKKEDKKINEFFKNPEDKQNIELTKKQLLRNGNKLNFKNGYLLEVQYKINGDLIYRIIKSYDEVKDIINKLGTLESNESTAGFGSDVEMIYDFIEYGDNIKFTWYNKNNYHKTHNGAYFKYYHNLNIDLSRYQVYSKYQKIDYETCLYYSLEKSGVNENILNSLKLMIFEKDILLRDLKKISEKFNLNITVSYNDNRNKTAKRIYNKNGKISINLGLVDEHYFINEETKYTSELFTNKRNHNKNNYLSSYDLIKKLYLEKEKYLTDITIENINNHNHFLKFNDNYELRDLKKVCTCDIKSGDYDCIFNDDICNCNHELCEMEALYENCEWDCKKSRYNEYQPYSKLSSKKIFKGKYKEEYNPNNNYRICFLDLETYNENIHKPYCLSFSFSDEPNIKCIYGLDCVEQFLNLIDNNLVIITHNLAFDFRGFINNVSKLQDPIETGTKLKHIQCKYKKYHLVFKDNCAFLPFKLSKLPEMFKLDSGDKDIYPYELINKNNISDNIDLNEVLKYIKENQHLDFINNCKKVNCLIDQKVDIKKYTIYYCNQDVNILKEAYLTFRNQILEITKIDIITLISLPQLADEYFKSRGVYNNCYKISGVAQDFIRKACHGGRVMCSENKKYHIKGEYISDFDAVSLYPSAMYRLDGYLQGIPKLITENIDWRNQDYYFVEIEILDIKIKRSFPLVSIKDDNNIKNFTNDIIGEKIIIDKISLEDLINFQDVKYRFIRGYYFNNGFNPKIKEVIEYMFNERIKLKKAGNPLQNAYKLILNASYGKLIQKPINKTKKFIKKNNKDYINYIVRNANCINEYHKINENLLCVSMKKSIIDHYTGCHMACQVLSMSKRIMNEVMTLAEDNDLKIYYQDTDSMHIKSSEISKLSEYYKNKYNRELIGKKMGQFHSDFEVKEKVNINKDYEIRAVESIFLGKKAYVDKLEYQSLDKKIKYEYHIRMKGIPSVIIENHDEDIIKTYKNLYDGEELTFDMVSACPLQLTKNYTAINRTSFIRKIKFN